MDENSSESPFDHSGDTSSIKDTLNSLKLDVAPVKFLFDDPPTSTHILGLIGILKGVTSEYKNACLPRDPYTRNLDTDEYSAALVHVSHGPDVRSSETHFVSTGGVESYTTEEDTRSDSARSNRHPEDNGTIYVPTII